MLQAPAEWGPGGWSAPCGSHDAHVTVIGPDVRSAEAGGAWRAVTRRDPAASLSVLARLRAACPALPAAPSPVPERRGRTRTCRLRLFMLRDVYRSIADNFGVSEARGVVFDSASALACRPLNPQKPAQAPRTRRPRHATPTSRPGPGGPSTGRSCQPGTAACGAGTWGCCSPGACGTARCSRTELRGRGGRGEEAWSGAPGLGAPSPAPGRGRGLRLRARRPPPPRPPSRGSSPGSGWPEGTSRPAPCWRSAGEGLQEPGQRPQGPEQDALLPSLGFAMATYSKVGTGAGG